MNYDGEIVINVGVVGVNVVVDVRWEIMSVCIMNIIKITVDSQVEQKWWDIQSDQISYNVILSEMFIYK